MNDIDKIAAAICNADGDNINWVKYVELYGDTCFAMERYRKMARAAAVVGTTHEVRTLRRKAKDLGRQLGRAGERVHILRCEVDSLRAMIRIDPRAYHVNLERMRAAEDKVVELQARVKELENPATQEVSE
jgi:hypothetical protein